MDDDSLSLLPLTLSLFSFPPKEKDPTPTCSKGLSLSLDMEVCRPSEQRNKKKTNTRLNRDGRFAAPNLVIVTVFPVEMQQSSVSFLGE